MQAEALRQEVEELKAKLAAVTKERDEAQAIVQEWAVQTMPDGWIGLLRSDRRTLAAQVKQMRATLQKISANGSEESSFGTYCHHDTYDVEKGARFEQGEIARSALALPVTDAEKEVG